MFCVNVTLEFVSMNAMSVSVVPLIFFGFMCFGSLQSQLSFTMRLKYALVVAW